MVREKAKRERLSLNKAVIRLLSELSGGHGKPAIEDVHHDLDCLAGAWGPEEAARFESALASLRTIDKDLWS